MDTSIEGLLKMKKFMFWINAHPQIEKQSNKDRNIPTRLENSGANIKTVLVFWLLIMTSAYVFITNCGLCGCVYKCE